MITLGRTDMCVFANPATARSAAGRGTNPSERPEEAR